MKSFLLKCLLLVCTIATAQRTITGKVINPTGEGIFAATVQVKGTERKATTDFDGNYSIEIYKDDIILFNAEGYGQQEVSILDNLRVVNIRLELSELIVIFTTGPCYPTKYMNSFLIHGTAYNTVGLQLDVINILPLHIDAGISHATNTSSNSVSNAYLNRPFYLAGKTSILAKINMQQANFNSLQFHKYSLEAATFLNLWNTYIAHTGLTLGHLNYDFATQQSTSLGYGIYAERYISFNKITSLPFSVELRGSITNWNSFIEKQAGAALNYSRFSINGQYQWLGDYEEFTLSAGYRIYF